MLGVAVAVAVEPVTLSVTLFRHDIMLLNILIRVLAGVVVVTAVGVVEIEGDAGSEGRKIPGLILPAETGVILPL